MKALLAAVCAACAVGLAAGIFAWHPWDAARNDGMDQNPNTEAERASSEASSSVEGIPSTADYGIDGDGWPIVGPPDYKFPDAETKARWESDWHTDNELRRVYGTKKVVEPRTGAMYVAAELIVYFRAGTSKESIDAAAEKAGGFVGSICTLGRGDIMTSICFDDDASMSQKERALSGAEGVSQISRDLVMQAA